MKTTLRIVMAMFLIIGAGQTFASQEVTSDGENVSFNAGCTRFNHDEPYSVTNTTSEGTTRSSSKEKSAADI